MAFSIEALPAMSCIDLVDYIQCHVHTHTSDNSTAKSFWRVFRKVFFFQKKLEPQFLRNSTWKQALEFSCVSPFCTKRCNSEN